jgi:hypothetical protein
VDGVRVRAIYYGFICNRFAEAVVVPWDSSAGKMLLSLLERRYAGRRINHETWLWVGDQIAIDYSGFCRLETSAFSFVHVFQPDRVTTQRGT